MLLYRMIEDPKEGEMVQFLAVHAVRWHEHPDEPTVAFIEDRQATKDAALGRVVYERMEMHHFTPGSLRITASDMSNLGWDSASAFMRAIADALAAEGAAK